MNLSNNPELSIASQRIAEDFEAFIARGGEVETVPRGAMAEAGWTSRQLVNRAISTKALRESEFAEREARKLAKASLPLPRGSERRPAKVKAPKPPKAPRPPQPVHAKTGRTKGAPRKDGPSKVKMVLATLANGPMTARQIAEANGWDRKLTSVNVNRMGGRGLVVMHARTSLPGVSHCIVWKLP